MRRRLIIDLLGFTGRRGGTETYAREIVTRLPELLPATDLIALVGRVGASEVRTFFPGVVQELMTVGESRASWALAEALRVEGHAHILRADVMWNPANFGPILRGVRRVTTIHDVIYHEIGGSGLDRASRAATGWIMRRSALLSDAILTVSRATREAASRVFAIPPERFHVVPNGCTDPAPHGETAAQLRMWNIPEGRHMILSAGNRMSHKNFEGLLFALREIPAGLRPVTVLVGGDNPDPLEPLVKQLGLAEDIRLPGWVSATDLESLYSRADLYVCPSLAEGFGLPVLDALRRGCRVVANDIPVLREVGGESVDYADARSPGDFAEAITTALSSRNDPERRRRGREWAAAFSWAAAAEGTAAVLDEQLSISRLSRDSRQGRT
jgi:glycosyltransferase involved in cell wall biosynthesis